MANCIRCGRKLPSFTFRKICQWCVQHEAAQRGELAEDAPQPVMATPWARRGESTITLTHVLFGVNVAVFIGMVLASENPAAFADPMHDFSTPLTIHWGANYGPFTLGGQWWRLLTYMFVHGSLIHIGFNMWCLWDLGRLCESLYGRWTYACIYLLTGVAAGLASIGWNPRIPSVGASGAIFGLAGALIASFYLGEFSMPKAALKGTLMSLLFFAGFSLFFGSVFPGIDNSAHIGGLVSGLILGALIAVIAPHSAARRVAVLGVMALAILGAWFGVDRWRGTPMKFSRADQALSENEPDRAISQLQAIIRQQPNMVQAHFALAQAFFNKQRFDQAEGEFKRVLELQPNNSAAQFDLGLVYLSQKRADEAQKLFEQVLAKDAGNSDAQYGLGLALADEGKYQPAADAFKKAIALGPETSGIYYELGRAYVELKMYDDAIAAFNQGKQKEGDNPDLEAGLADAYQAKGMTQQAQDARNKAAQLKSASH